MHIGTNTAGWRMHVRLTGADLDIDTLLGWLLQLLLLHINNAVLKGQAVDGDTAPPGRRLQEAPHLWLTGRQSEECMFCRQGAVRPICSPLQSKNKMLLATTCDMQDTLH